MKRPNILFIYTDQQRWDTIRANGNPDMVLTLTIKSGFLGLGRRLEVRATCGKHNIEIPDPPIGCPKCSAERPDLASLFGELDK